MSIGLAAGAVGLLLGGAAGLAHFYREDLAVRPVEKGLLAVSLDLPSLLHRRFLASPTKGVPDDWFSTAVIRTDCPGLLLRRRPCSGLVSVKRYLCALNE